MTGGATEIVGLFLTRWHDGDEIGTCFGNGENDLGVPNNIRIGGERAESDHEACPGDGRHLAKPSNRLPVGDNRSAVVVGIFSASGSSPPE
jgi:hypothetical protein